MQAPPRLFLHAFMSGEAPRALLAEGATLAPIIEKGAVIWEEWVF